MSSLHELEKKIKLCRLCSKQLEPNPVISVDPKAKLLIIGQAPGTSVHRSGIPWNDPSGNTLRAWMQVDREQFYEDPRIGIVPMAFCYPGTGPSGDLPPPPICAATWHKKLFAHMPDLELIILAGSYACREYLTKKLSLTEMIKQRHSFPEPYFPLVHPSPRNRLWMKKNPWFDREVIPELRERLSFLR